MRSVTSADGLVKGEIVGIPAPASKFSQLQIGMTLEQVEHLIGMPYKSDSRITGKQYQPFYFGGDTQRTEAYYKGEGHLTFSNSRPDSAAGYADPHHGLSRCNCKTLIRVMMMQANRVRSGLTDRTKKNYIPRHCVSFIPTSTII